jgi:hypothetical protein
LRALPIFAQRSIRLKYDRLASQVGIRLLFSMICPSSMRLATRNPVL